MKKGINIKINIRKKHLWFLTGLILLVIGVGLVVAFTTDGSGTPSVMGHSMDEIEIPVCDDGQILEYSGEILICGGVEVGGGTTVGGGYLGTHDNRADCGTRWGTMSSIKGTCVPQSPGRDCNYYCICSKGTMRDTDLNEIFNPLTETIIGRYYICTLP